MRMAGQGNGLRGAAYPGQPMAIAATAPISHARPPGVSGPRRLRDLPAPVLAALAVILLVAFALRAWSATHPVPDPGPDADAYSAIAEHLFETGRYGTPNQTSPSDWSPGLPLLVAALYTVIGAAQEAAARMLIAVLGTVMVLFTFLIGRRLAGVAVGLLAAALVATYPTYIENNGQLLSEPLAAFLLTGGLLGVLWAAERRSLLSWALPGLAFGALTLTRPEYQAITLAFAALVLWRGWRDAGPRRGLASAAVLIVAAALVVAPWMVRNRVELGKWVPVSTGGGKALFVATYLPGDGRQVPVKRELMRRYLGAKDPITTSELRAQPMQPLLDRVASRHPDLARDEALGRIGRENMRRYLTEQPGAYAQMSAAKLWNVWERGSSPYMRAAGWVAYHRLLLLFAVAGFAVLMLARSTRWPALLLACPVAAISVLGTILLAVPRRQVPLIPLISVFAAVALVWIVMRLRERRADGRLRLDAS
jgi:4-amino-4-deoxy-L-arabinose transferase-like glycosyltransferase